MANSGVSVDDGRVLRLAALLVGTGLALAACGSSSSGGTASGAVGVTPTTATSTPAPTPTSASTTAPNSGGSDSGSSFCTEARAFKAQAQSGAKAYQLDKPAQLAVFEQQALTELGQFAAQAPSAIKSDVAVAVAGETAVVAQIKQAGYDFKKVDQTKLEAIIDTPAFKNATNNIDAYMSSTCGISSTS